MLHQLPKNVFSSRLVSTLAITCRLRKLSFEERFGNVAADQTRSLGPSAAHDVDEPLRSNVDRLVERAEREERDREESFPESEPTSTHGDRLVTSPGTPPNDEALTRHTMLVH